MTIPPPLVADLITWITPLWVLGLGALAGLTLLFVFWGILAIGSRRIAVAVAEGVREGLLWPLLFVLVFFAGLGVVTSFSVHKPFDILSSLSRVKKVGTDEFNFELTETATDIKSETFYQPREKEIPVPFHVVELQRLLFESTVDLLVSTRAEEDPGPVKEFRVTAGETFSWLPPQKAVEFFPNQHVNSLYVRNLGGESGALTVTVQTELRYPEVRAIPLMAGMIFTFFLFYLALLKTCPKISAIALATLKSETAQPLFFVAMCLGVFLLLIFIFIPYNTFGEDVKLLKDSGMTLIMILSLIVAVYAAGSSVAEEIEGRTALTVLSKPVGRRHFVFGKFLGIIWILLLIFVVLGVLFLGTVSYKVVYDARETANPEPEWQDCYAEMVRTIPGLMLFFFETVTLTALSVAISTRLPMLANFMIMLAVYVLGHLTPLIVQSAIGRLELVVFVGRLIATVVPVLDHFKVQAALASGAPIPWDYVAWAMVYCVLYSTVAMLLALALFEDRDLA